MVFAFHDLPILVRWKIMRQYIPFYTKVTVLSKMHEFSTLMEYNESWLNPSPAFFRVFHLICSLRCGLYMACCPNDSQYCYQFSMDDHRQKFTFKCFFLNRNSNVCCKKKRYCQTFSPQDLENFLQHLVNHYKMWPETLILYNYAIHRHFFFDRASNMIHWHDGRIYPFEGEVCTVKKQREDGTMDMYKLSVKENQMMYVQDCTESEIYHSVCKPNPIEFSSILRRKWMYFETDLTIKKQDTKIRMKSTFPHIGPYRKELEVFCK